MIYKYEEDYKMEILRVENLTKTYGKGNTAVTALDNVSFSVNKGSLWLLSVLPVQVNPLYFI